MRRIPVDNCYGCSACYNICPKNAIQMLPDQEGFLYPKVNVEECISCGLCERVCPSLYPPQLTGEYEECVVVQHKNKEVLYNSTSGGCIDALYEFVLNNKHGFAAGVIFDNSFMPMHIVTDQYEKAKAFRNSKYAQSDLRDVFRDIRKLLLQGSLVIFVGTPCQVAGLKTFLQSEYVNLITVDLVCRSIPSPKLWKSYLQWQEEKYRDRITSVACRKKTYGYHSGALEIQFARGKCYRGSNRVDYYMKSFHHDICSRPSCYNCAFKTKHRCSDFTVFDAWKPQEVVLKPMKDNDEGYSNVLVHTEKGKKLLSEINNIVVYQAEAEKMFLFTGGMESHSIHYSEARDTFYKDLDQLGFPATVQKYVKISWLDQMIEALKPIRYALKNFSKETREKLWS